MGLTFNITAFNNINNINIFTVGIRLIGIDKSKCDIKIKYNR